MKQNENKSSRPFSATESAPNYLGRIVPKVSLDPVAPPEPLTFPTFPSIDELLKHEAGTQPHPLLKLTDTPPPSPTSLFDGLLGGRPEVLLQDALANPTRYEPATREALAALGGKRSTELTPEDRRILNLATIDYASVRPRYAAPTKAGVPRPPAQKPKSLDQDSLGDGRAPQVETPGGTMSAYWWLG